MKKRPIFQKILLPMMFLMLAEIIIFTFSIFSQGLLEELRKNETEVINEKVDSRQGYIQNFILHSWMNLNYTVDRINTITEQQLYNSTTSIDTLCEDYQSASGLLTRTVPSLIAMMQNNRVTGAYMILNTKDLAPSMESGEYESKQGVYIHNNAPDAQNIEHNKNVQMMRSPISVVQTLEIAMDSSWDANFDFAGNSVPYYDFFYRPFQTAYENKDRYSWNDMGCWSGPFTLAGTNYKAITYSVPLILNNGTVYGVLGIDISLDYFRSLLSSKELSRTGTYFLAQYSADKSGFSNVFGSSNDNWIDTTYSDDLIHCNRSDYYLHEKEFNLYTNNTPFSDEVWVLAGVVPYDTLYSFFHKFQQHLLLAIILTFLAGLIVSLILSYRLQLPIMRLVAELQNKDSHEYVQLHPTGITEIDRLSQEVERLTKDILENGSKFSTILTMSSTWIAGFQIDQSDNSLFVTDHFFSIFGRNDISTKNMTIPEFHQTMEDLSSYIVIESPFDQNIHIDGTLYEIPSQGKSRFVRVKILESGNNIFGLAEDVTQSLLEKRILTHERDHDSLTNLYNRRAFRTQLSSLMTHHADLIGIGAFVMLDLDNLKYINDTYGHNYGDHYIIQASDALRSSVTDKTIYARISGDEFNLFFYGYHNRTDLEKQIEMLRRALSTMSLTLPDGTRQKVQASGGVAWYPEDSTDMDTLAKYADYTMYMAKKMSKGEIWNFNKKFYNSQNTQLQKSAALTRLIVRHEVYYAFQPIVDAHTGEIFGYEALMRPTAKEFSSVTDVLETARNEGKLNQIEDLTWEMSLEKYEYLIENDLIPRQSHIFINSLPDQRMNIDLENKLHARYAKYMNRIVLELTEEGQASDSTKDSKLDAHRKSGGMVALDDYGTGYNNEKILLTVAAEFLKIDIAIIKNIHLNPDKQSLMDYFVNYTHTRGNYVIAEGVETREELETVIRLGADYVQGYYLAKPARDPVSDIPADVKTIIQEQNKFNL